MIPDTDLAKTLSLAYGHVVCGSGSLVDAFSR